MRQITRGGDYDEPALSPDGRTIAFIHVDTKPAGEGDSATTSLWVGDALTGTTRRLLAPAFNATPERNLSAFQAPLFSLDGGFVYINADAWTTSNAVHQISVTTGKERFVVDGALLGVIRDGQYRGYLLVQQHRYRKAPRTGSYDPVYVIRPDGVETMLVPGTDSDHDAAKLTAVWLTSNGWHAW